MNLRKDKIKYTLWLNKAESVAIEELKKEVLFDKNQRETLSEILIFALSRGDLNK